MLKLGLNLMAGICSGIELQNWTVYGRNDIGLLHLKSIHPLWKILEKCFIGGMCTFKYTYLLCDFRSGLSQTEQIFYLEVSNEFISLKFTLPLCKMFPKSSTPQRVCGIQVEQPIVMIYQVAVLMSALKSDQELNVRELYII